MSSKSSYTNIWLLVGVILAVLALFYLLFLSEKTYNWSETYNPNVEEPYGISIFKDLVERAHPEQPFVVIKDSVHLRVSADTLPPYSNYFLVGRELYLDSAEQGFLLDFVNSGNNAFIISNTFNHALIDTLLDVYVDDYYYYDYEYLDGFAPVTVIQRSQDTSVFLNMWANGDVFEHPIEIKFVRNNEPRNKVWSYFHSEMYAKSEQPIDILGYYGDGFANYIRIPFGKGYFYLHSTPLAFTNYALLNDSTFQYVAQATAFSGDGTILWDDYNRKYQRVRNQHHEPQTGTNYSHDEGPLSFILSERSLSWAWFILIGSILLYMLFGAKRKQRSIPVIHPLKNTSLDFAETIGTMFRMENNHAKLVRLKMRLFKAFVRERYGIRTAIEPDEEEELIEHLAEKADLPLDQVNTLFTQFHSLENKSNVEAIELIHFHQQLEQFYQNAR